MFWSCTRKPSLKKATGQLIFMGMSFTALSTGRGEVTINKIEETENKKAGSRFLLELVGRNRVRGEEGYKELCAAGHTAGGRE